MSFRLEPGVRLSARASFPHQCFMNQLLRQWTADTKTGACVAALRTICPRGLPGRHHGKQPGPHGTQRPWASRGRSTSAGGHHPRGAPETQPRYTVKRHCRRSPRITAPILNGGQDKASPRSHLPERAVRWDVMHHRSAESSAQSTGDGADEYEQHEKILDRRRRISRPHGESCGFQT
jgi:hypothetical protein